MLRLATISIAALLLSTVAMAQNAAPKPGPELAKLDVFVGHWILDGNMKAGTMGPAGSITENETCEWMDGHFFLLCHFDYKSSIGNGVGLHVMGYSRHDKAYTYREFNSLGIFDDARGTLDGDTWTWTDEEKMGGTTVKGRFTMKMTSSTSYDFSFDSSQDGTTWSTVMEGKASKK
ncbi:MAG: DUF1579 family protein [Candidatus Sulfotelmatobacter sp.]